MKVNRINASNLFSTIDSIKAAHVFTGQLGGKLLRFDEISSNGFTTLYVFEKSMFDWCFNMIGVYVFED
jgi:hypothetical protein